jgi:ankyrin repeat protein
MKKLSIFLLAGILSCTVAFPQTKTDKQYTKFVKCAKKRNMDKARTYVIRGYNIDARDNLGKTPLLYCLQNNNEDFAKFFMDNGANIQITDYQGNTSLHYAIKNDKIPDMVYFLIEKGVKIDVANDKGYTPFHYSVLYSCDHIDIPFYLIKNGVDYKSITRLHENALHLSLESGCDTISSFLINNGIDINMIDQNGNNPLLKALIGVRALISRQYSEQGVDMTLVAPYIDKQIKENNVYGRSLMAQRLIKLGADINLRNVEGRTSLFYAIDNDDEIVVNMLLNRNFKLKQSEDDEKTYLYLAAEHENAAIVEALLRSGAENPMLCDIHDNCYYSAFVYSVNARLVPDDQKLSYFQNALNIYKVALDKYQTELNKIRARNTAKVCGQACLIVGSAAAGSYYYGPVGGVDYETERRNYLNSQIEKCKSKITKYEYVVNCINQGQTRIEDCYQ